MSTPEHSVVRDSNSGLVEPSMDSFRADVARTLPAYERIRYSDDPEVQLQADYIKLTIETRQAVIDAHDSGEPFISNNYCTAPEITEALGLPAYCLYTMSQGAGLTTEEHTQQLDDVSAMGLSSDLCTLIRGGIYYVERGLAPLPTAVIGLLMPCDGMPMLHQVMMHNPFWKDVPIVCPDPPYFRDTRGIDYFANELKKMVAFLEETTGRVMNRDRLVEVVEESNRQYELWHEYNELRRSVPCPHGFSTGGSVCYSVAQVCGIGKPEGTAWFEKLVNHAEERVEAGQGGIPHEKIRVLWFDILPSSWGREDLFPWLEQEYGAVLVNSMTSFNQYSLIDMSSEDEMWRGLAKRGLCDTPMVRQAGGAVDTMVHDIERIVQDFSVDVVIWPGHMGHKEAHGSYGILRETCKKVGVPFLELQVDLWDSTYQDPDEMKERIVRFFQAKGLI